MTALPSRPYWERIWIFQEYTIARPITLHCGDYPCQGVILENALDGILQAYFIYSVLHRLKPKAFSKSDTAALIEIYQSPGVSMSRQQVAHKNLRNNRILLNLIESHKCCKATDERDKVYVLLGLAGDTQGTAFPVDYMKSVSEVMEDVLSFNRNKEL